MARIWAHGGGCYTIPRNYARGWWLESKAGGGLARCLLPALSAAELDQVVVLSSRSKAEQGVPARIEEPTVKIPAFQVSAVFSEAAYAHFRASMRLEAGGVFGVPSGSKVSGAYW